MSGPADGRRLVVCRYEHGGARIYFDRAGGVRDLVADLYDDERAERREAIIGALIAAGILPAETEQPTLQEVAPGERIERWSPSRGRA